MAFSGGSYEEVARWLRNFLASHAKREDPRIEVVLEAGDERQGRSYGARLVLGDQTSDLLEFDYKEVAAQRGNLARCQAMAERTRALARALIMSATGAPRAR